MRIPNSDAIIVFYQFKKIILTETLYTAFDIDEVYDNKNFVFKIFNYVRHFNIAARIDRFINAITGNQEFIGYIPALYLFSKALITNPNCSSFNFIEEGLLNYYKEETLSNLSAINSKDSWRSSLRNNTKRVLFEMYMVLRGYNFKLQSLPFSYSCFNSFQNVFFYGLTDKSFPLINVEKRIIVPFEKKSSVTISTQTDISISNSFIWIGDAGVVQHGFSERLYLEGIENGCINFLKSKFKSEIIIKFHREESESLREKIKNLFTVKGISFQIIPDSVIMEVLLFDAANVLLIGIYSSLLYYATLLGHRSYSIYEFVQKEYSRTLLNRDFNFFWAKVTLLKASHESPHLNSMEY
jgi:hypothetical protein